MYVGGVCAAVHWRGAVAVVHARGAGAVVSPAAQNHDRRLRTEFSGRFTHQRCPRRKPREGRRLIRKRPHAPAPPPAENHESVRPPKKSTAAPPKTTRGSSITSRILRTLLTPAPPPAQNHERVVDCEQDLEDAPRAATLRLRIAPQRERCNTHETRRGFAGDVENSHGISTRAIRHAQSPQTTLKIRTAPQREPFDTHDPRRGLANEL